jgi:hypothetical protein
MRNLVLPVVAELRADAVVIGEELLILALVSPSLVGTIGHLLILFGKDGV